jgi:hypothetical protein
MKKVILLGLLLVLFVILFDIYYDLKPIQSMNTGKDVGFIITAKGSLPYPKMYHAIMEPKFSGIQVIME